MPRAALVALLTALACSASPRRRSPPAPVPPGPVEPAPAPAPTPAPVEQAALTVPAGVRLPRPFAIERAELAQEIDPSKDSLTGQVRYEGELREATAVLWLHAEKLTITRATIAQLVTPEPGAGAKPAPPPVTLEVVTGLARGRVALRARRALGAGLRYQLDLEYTAPIDGVQTAGTFRQQLDGRWYAYTQHEPVAARRSFPCLDEPDLKIPWTLTLTAPAGLVAVSNAPEASRATMADGRTRVLFAPTEPLPSYLVAYAVGPFDIVPAGVSGGGAPIRILTPAGKAAEAAFAAAATPKLLAALERWFGSPYPFAKLDSVAIPTTVGFSAMENPGMITYTERLLLMPADAAESRKQRYARVGLHELAHQWFGDLVTPVWWDDIWLNESFASWLPAKVIGEVYPAYRRSEDDTTVRSATLGGDALSSARRVRQPIVAEDDIVNAFDAMSYGKGASVLRMMEAWAGVDAFQAGVRDYLEAHARGNATATDFVRAIAARTEAPEIERAFASFLDQPGAPRIAATIDCGGGAAPAVRLEQRRYVPLGAGAVDGAARWRLPVCVVAGAGAEVERACGVLDGDAVRIPLERCPRWVWPNADGRGYYRGALSAEGWAAVNTAWKRLGPAEKVAAAQDLWAAVQAGEVGVDVAMGWVPALLAEKSPRAVQVAAEMIGWLRAWAAPADRARLSAWIGRTLGARARALGWLRRPGDTIDDEDARDRLVPLAAMAGDRALGRAAVKLSADWRALPEAARRAVLQAAVRADPAVHDRLLADFRGEKDHGRAGDLAAALGVVRDPARLSAALGLVIDQALDVRDVIGVLGAAMGEEETRAVAEPFVIERFDAILARLPDEWGAGQVGALTASCDASKVEPMRALAEAKLAGRRGARRRIDQAFERMGQCVAQREAQASALAAWLARAR
jgi:alanyl aminopeptidase